MAKSLNDILPAFDRLTKKPEDYLSVQASVSTGVREFLKELYDFTKCVEHGVVPSGDALPELIIQGFDEEQIWQELELQNEGRSGGLVSDVASLVARKDRLKFPVRLKNEDGDSELGSGEVELQGTGDLEVDEGNGSSNGGLPVASDNESDLSADKGPTMRKQKVWNRASVVDDQFFKLSEMERFLEQEDQREAGQHGSSDESVDLFMPSDNEDDEGLEDPQYAEFFDAPHENREDHNLGEESEAEEMEVEEEDQDGRLVKSDEVETGIKKVRFDELGTSSDEDETVGVKSSLEMREERLRARIGQLEERALSEKPWQMKGEVSASSRPQNSLLEETVEFDLTTRPAPIITEQTTLQLEDIILQRVKDRAWDDVERKVKPVETPNEYKKKLVLDQEKSKISLAQVYEQEYIKQREAQKADGDDDRPQEEPPEYQTVRTMMASLFSMLDALSNFHFTPRAPAPEVKIVSNLPAISIEEVAPVASSDAALLAPEEVRERPKGDVIGNAERTSTDKKRDRRHKKIKQRVRQHEREKRERIVEKLRPGLGNKYSKERALQDLEKVTKSSNVTQVVEKDNAKAVRSSTAFFNRLQDEVKSHIKMRTGGDKPRLQKDARSAKKLKL